VIFKMADKMKIKNRFAAFLLFPIIVLKRFKDFYF